MKEAINKHEIVIAMENHIHIHMNTCSSKSAPLGMHNSSQTISKSKPKIRIIHIFAPEIIKTDATNFRELVQRLTGKPTATRARKKEAARILCSHKKMEMAMMAGFHAAGLRERIKLKGEEEIWRTANSGGGFLGEFAEFDAFMQELNHFPLLEPTASQNIVDANGLSQLA